MVLEVTTTSSSFNVYFPIVNEKSSDAPGFISNLSNGEVSLSGLLLNLGNCYVKLRNLYFCFIVVVVIKRFWRKSILYISSFARKLP